MLAVLFLHCGEIEPERGRRQQPRLRRPRPPLAQREGVRTPQRDVHRDGGGALGRRALLGHQPGPEDFCGGGGIGIVCSSSAVLGAAVRRRRLQRAPASPASSASPQRISVPAPARLTTPDTPSPSADVAPSPVASVSLPAAAIHVSFRSFSILFPP